jgi:hypothetical protein
MNKKALVTLAIGDRYIENWKRYCEPGWSRYATAYGFDIICITAPLDLTPRASARSPAWQKCLILSQPFANQYERIVWVDSDIIFNVPAPDVTDGVPEDKIGIVEDPGFNPLFLQRYYQRCPESIINFTPQDYYTQYGLPAGCLRACNTGLMVMAPSHAALLEQVYYQYEEKGGREWHMEQRPLSYELVRRDLVHWLDPRFNVCVPIEEYVRYPFLLPPLPAPVTSLRSRIARKVQRLLATSATLRKIQAAKLEASPVRKAYKAALSTMFTSSYFLHFGGRIEEMKYLDQTSKMGVESAKLILSHVFQGD